MVTLDLALFWLFPSVMVTYPIESITIQGEILGTVRQGGADFEIVENSGTEWARTAERNTSAHGDRFHVSPWHKIDRLHGCGCIPNSIKTPVNRYNTDTKPIPFSSGFIPCARAFVVCNSALKAYGFAFSVHCCHVKRLNATHVMNCEIFYPIQREGYSQAHRAFLCAECTEIPWTHLNAVRGQIKSK